jgi:hypothetical protein
LKCAFTLKLDKPILLLAVYQEVGIALNASPSKLGTLTFTRAVVQALCSPLAGFLAMHYDRGTVIGMGTLVWAAATLGVGLSTTYFQAMIGRAVTGVRRPSRIVVSRRDGMKLSGCFVGQWKQQAKRLSRVFAIGSDCRVTPTMEVDFGFFKAEDGNNSLRHVFWTREISSAPVCQVFTCFYCQIAST